MPDLFATLPEKAEAGKDGKNSAMKRMITWPSIWCCSVPPKKNAAGHVWYDMFWDVVPRTNRHGKLVDAPFTPTFGP